MTVVTAIGVRRLWRDVQVPKDGPTQNSGGARARHRGTTEQQGPSIEAATRVHFVGPSGAKGPARAAALYKRGVPLSVEPNWVSFFGSPLAPTGQENAVLQITESSRPRSPGDPRR